MCLVYFSGNTSEQIFLKIHRASQEAGLYTEERSVIMPLFSVSSELQVEKYLKEVHFNDLTCYQCFPFRTHVIFDIPYNDFSKKANS